MKTRSTLFYLIAFIGVLAVASVLSAMSAVAPAPASSHSGLPQATLVAPTLPPEPTLPPGATPPVIVVTGTSAVVPATGGGGPIGGSWLFLAILVIAGLAFLVAIFALMRRPYP